jgi:hypothetical protein
MDNRTEHEKDLDALSTFLKTMDNPPQNEWRTNMVKESFIAGRESLRQQLAKPADEKTYHSIEQWKQENLPELCKRESLDKLLNQHFSYIRSAKATTKNLGE